MSAGIAPNYHSLAATACVESQGQLVRSSFAGESILADYRRKQKCKFLLELENPSSSSQDER